jgi:hypothetical protein
MSYNFVTVKFQLHATQHSLLIVPLRVLHTTLSNKQARGGVIGGKGYGFQAAYIVSRIPIWLADPDFVQFIQHDQGRGHHIGEVRRLLQALRPGAPEGLQHRCGDVIGVFRLVARTLKRMT